jgi:hypothetical protein
MIDKKIMHKIEVKDHYRDKPGTREHVCLEKGTSPGISFGSSKERDDAMQILAQQDLEGMLG